MHLERLHGYPNEVMIVENLFYVEVFCQNHIMSTSFAKTILCGTMTEQKY